MDTAGPKHDEGKANPPSLGERRAPSSGNLAALRAPENSVIDRSEEPIAGHTFFRLAPNDPLRVPLALEALRNPDQGRLAFARAIRALSESGAPEATEALMQVLQGKFPHLDHKLSEHAASSLLSKSSGHFIAHLEGLPLDSDARYAGTAALGREITQERFAALIRAVNAGGEVLPYVALDTLDRALSQRGERIPWSLRRTEAIENLLTFGIREGVAGMPAGAESPTIDRGPEELATALITSAELRAVLKSAVAGLAQGFDGVLVNAVRRASDRKSCLLAFEILEERKSPELIRAAREMLGDPRSKKDVIELFAESAWLRNAVALEAREVVERSLLKRVGDFLGRLNIPLPTFLDPEQTRFGFGVIYRGFLAPSPKPMPNAIFR